MKSDPNNVLAVESIAAIVREKNYQRSNLLVFSSYLVFLKFIQIDRIVRISRKYREAFERTWIFSKFSQLKKLMVFLQLLVILSKILLVIHFISSIWMRFSSNCSSTLADAFAHFMYQEYHGIGTDIERLQELDQVMRYVNMISFYLIAMTLTVIGYGDPKSMPNFEQYPEDYKILLFCMLFGFLSFQ